MRVGDFLNRLSGVKSRKGAWIARCPAHEDHGLSLRVKEGDGGGIQFECDDGCPAEAILDALDPKPIVPVAEPRANGARSVSALEIPTAEEVFDRPYPPSPPIPPAWEAGSSIAVEIADREIARLLVNCCLCDPPITEEEIRAFARRFKISKDEAEIEIRGQRGA